MSAPVLEAPRVADATQPIPEWRHVALPLALGLLLLGLLFNSEVNAAVKTWIASTAYNHCFLIIPIVLYLLWDRRMDLVGVSSRPVPVALLLGIPLAAIWLIAERLGIMEGRQIVAITFVELLFFALLGKRLFWAMSGPLLYLYFLVPFGEFLTPRLQDITTWFIRHGLDIFGIPAYIDGYVIEIPQGTFFVAEACAGLRFLIASIAFGCLYALIMYRSPVRRGMFILVSLVVPIVANGFRGLGIVSLGYLLGSAQAAATDHVLYGWIFFSIVILMLIGLGLPFRQDELSTRSASPSGRTLQPRGSLRGMLAITAGLVVIAAMSPSVAAWLSRSTATPVASPASIDAGPGCTVTAIAPPGAVAARIRTERVVCGDGVPMDIAWATFSPRITAAPLMAERRRMVFRAETEGLAENWLQTPDSVPSTWRIMKSNDPEFITAVSMWVDGQAVRPGLAMRLRMATDSLFGSACAPTIVTVTPVADWENGDRGQLRQTEDSLPAFLLAHPGLIATIAKDSAH